jgi:hypothetical protein
MSNKSLINQRKDLRFLLTSLLRQNSASALSCYHANVSGRIIFLGRPFLIGL